MTTPTTTALQALYDAVVVQFATDATAVPNEFGWSTPKRRGAKQNRICWVPGDPSGAAGAFAGPRNPGGNPRALARLDELFTVIIEGLDDSDLEDELLQYNAARLILDAWYRAVYLQVRNLLKVKSTSWMIDRTARRRGATVRLVCILEATVPDTAYPVVPRVEGETETNARAEIEMQLDGDDDPLTYTAEDLAVGDEPPEAVAGTTANITLSGTQTIDDVAVSATENVLVTDQTDAAENGLWVAAAGAWSRHPDADESSELFTGYFVHVLPGGTVNGDSGWQLTTTGTIVVGTTPLTFERVSP